MLNASSMNVQLYISINLLAVLWILINGQVILLIKAFENCRKLLRTIVKCQTWLQGRSVYILQDFRLLQSRVGFLESEVGTISDIWLKVRSHDSRDALTCSIGWIYSTWINSIHSHLISIYIPTPRHAILQLPIHES